MIVALRCADIKNKMHYYISKFFSLSYRALFSPFLLNTGIIKSRILYYFMPNTGFSKFILEMYYLLSVIKTLKTYLGFTFDLQTLEAAVF